MRDWPSGHPLSETKMSSPGQGALLAERWNRIIVQSSNLEDDVQALKNAGVKFRNEIVSGPGGRQILLEDPSGNPVELFEPAPDSTS